MRRPDFAYAGNRPFFSSRGGSAAQPTEASNYFGRMTVAPSATFRNAVNTAIAAWKAQGNWSRIKGLWLHCADTQQAALLSVIGDTPRDATLTGAPTFTALKGFSGFSATKQVNWPITSTILASDSVIALFSGNFLTQDDGGGTSYSSCLIRSDAGVAANTPGHLTAAALGGGTGGAALGNTVMVPLTSVPGSTGYAIAVAAGGTFTTGASLRVASGSAYGAARSSNYRTNPDNLTALNQLSAYGFLDAATTLLQTQKFLTTLAALMQSLGAFD